MPDDHADPLAPSPNLSLYRSNVRNRQLTADPPVIVALLPDLLSRYARDAPTGLHLHRRRIFERAGNLEPGDANLPRDPNRQPGEEPTEELPIVDIRRVMGHALFDRAGNFIKWEEISNEHGAGR